MSGGGAQRADTVAIEDVEDALHLVPHIGFAGEDPSAYGFIALGIWSLGGGDGAQTVGSPRTTARRRAVSLVTWGMIRSIGICLIVGEAGRQLPLVVTNITILCWIPLLYAGG